MFMSLYYGEQGKPRVRHRAWMELAESWSKLLTAFDCFLRSEICEIC